jgi:hypothetical protein
MPPPYKIHTLYRNYFKLKDSDLSSEVSNSIRNWIVMVDSPGNERPIPRGGLVGHLGASEAASPCRQHRFALHGAFFVGTYIRRHFAFLLASLLTGASIDQAKLRKLM